jgi:hypothetical protein
VNVRFALVIGPNGEQLSFVAVEWEDITSYTRTSIPDDFEPYRLRKLTCGVLWKNHSDYIVVVGDYDLTNQGRDYRHNDFHLIPTGVIRSIIYLDGAPARVRELKAETA